MLAYLVRRLALMVPVAFLVSVAVFSLIHLTPVDPAELILGEERSPQAVAALRHELGLDQPLPQQYLSWIGRALHGDHGDQHAVYPLVDAGRTQPGLHPDGAGERRELAPGDLGPRAEERADPGGDDRRHPGRVVAGRGAGDRDDLLLAGRRQAGDRQHLRPRLSHHPGHRAGDRVLVHARQPGGRHGLCVAEPQDQLRMSAVYGPALPEKVAETPVSQPTSIGTLFRTYPRVAVASGLLLLLVLVALLAPWIALHDPIATDPSNALLGPSGAHPFGTDELGRDLFARVIWGSRVSLPVAFVSVAVGLLVGGTVGLAAGYRGSLTDLFLMRVIDAILAFPALILAIAIVAVLGPGLRNAMIAIGIVQVPVYARLMRAQVLTLKELDFVAAVRALGASPARLIVSHFLPNLLNPLIVQISLSAAAAMLAEATLSFLGLGAQPPTADWGFMMNTGARFLNNDPWLALGPGLAISIAVFAFNWLGDALRDALDPRLRQ